ncbi:hypothetical protein THAOC_04641 [Thalassiosira oceanica]|uniref:Uncharacterized protein n=1 Tax=Thalassiosira oceanica TaxID=159749 RepID=K0TIV3_THAOC|nr:hypothetical protein THAOC_04641 [Thalassiosira oceanica]|eukprot:EJK73716.1 hypothetical protein THAOC_04641 [Thalassiosira oceanica]
MHTEFESSGDRYGVKIVAIQEWGTIWEKNRLPSNDTLALKVGYCTERRRCWLRSWHVSRQAACGGLWRHGSAAGLLRFFGINWQTRASWLGSVALLTSVLQVTWRSEVNIRQVRGVRMAVRLRFFRLSMKRVRDPSLITSGSSGYLGKVKGKQARRSPCCTAYN